MADYSRAGPEARNSDPLSPDEPAISLPRGPQETQRDGIDLSEIADFSTFKEQLEKVIAEHRQSKDPANKEAVEKLQSELNTLSNSLGNWQENSSFAEIEQPLAAIYRLLEETELAAPSSIQTSTAAWRNSRFPVSIAIKTERAYQADFTVRGSVTYRDSWGRTSQQPNQQSNLTPGSWYRGQRIAASEREGMARVEIDDSGKNYVVRFAPGFRGSCDVAIGDEVHTFTSNGSTITHHQGGASLNIDRDGLLAKLRAETEAASSPAAYAVHRFSNESGFELNGRMTDDHYVVTASRGGTSVRPPLYLSRTLSLAEAKSALASYIRFASEHEGSGLIHSTVDGAAALSVAKSSALHSLLQKQRSLPQGVRLAYLGTEDGISSYRFYQTTHTVDGVQRPPRWISEAIAVDERQGIGQRDKQLLAELESQDLVKKAAAQPLRLSGSGSNPELIDPSTHGWQTYRTISRAIESGFEIRRTSETSFAIRYRGHQVQPPVNTNTAAGLAPLEERLAELLERPPIVEARLTEVAKAAGFELDISPRNDGQLLYLRREGRRLAPPLVLSEGTNAAQAEELLGKLMSRARAGRGLDVASVVEGVDALPLSAEDGALFELLKKEDALGAGGLALALVDADRNGVSYRFFQTKHTVDSAEIAPRWIGKSITIPNEASGSEAFQPLAELAKELIEKRSQPAVLIGAASEKVQPIAVDLFSAEQETYDAFRRASKLGFSVQRLEDGGFAVGYQGGVSVAALNPGGAQEEQLQAVAENLRLQCEHVPLALESEVDDTTARPIDVTTPLPAGASADFSPYETYRRALESGFVVKLSKDSTTDEKRTIEFQIYRNVDAPNGDQRLESIGPPIQIDRNEPQYFERRNYLITQALATHLAHPPITIASEAEGFSTRPIDFATSPEAWKALNEADGITIAHARSFKHEAGYQHEYEVRSADPETPPVTLRLLSGSTLHERRNALLQAAVQSLENPNILQTAELPFAAAEQPPALLYNAPALSAALEDAREAGYDLRIESVTRSAYLLRFHHRSSGESVGSTIRFSRQELESAAGRDEQLAGRIEAGLEQLSEMEDRGRLVEELVVDFKDTSAGFRSVVRGQLGMVPAKLLRDLSQGGVKVNAQHYLEQQRKYSGSPRGWPKGSMWAEVGGVYSPSSKIAVIAELTYEPDTKTWHRVNEYPHTVLHELGHAVDQLLGHREPPYIRRQLDAYSYRQEENPAYKHGISSLPSFIAAYEKDRAGIEAAGVEGKLKYFLQEKNGDRRAGREEAFAEAFDVLVEGPSARRYQLFQQYFPNVLAEMRTILQSNGYQFPTSGGEPLRFAEVR